MTEHDRWRMVKALECKANRIRGNYDTPQQEIDDLHDAIRGLQSTDDPSLVPLHDEMLARLQKLEAKKEKPAIDLLKEWLTRNESRTHFTNEWLCGKDLDVYVRKGYRMLVYQDHSATTLEIANIAAHPQGQGAFTRFLEEVEKINPYPVIFIENVLEERFQNFFLKRNYQPIPWSNPPCFYKLKRD